MVITVTERKIGVDFGTTTSAVYYANVYDDGTTQGHFLHFPDGHSNYVPTLIYKPADEGEVCFGWQAEARGDNDPEHLYGEFKMELLDSQKAEAAERRTRQFFKYMYKIYQNKAIQISGDEINSANTSTVVTYPAIFTDTQREILKKAAEDAGFPNVSMLTESEAAMWYASTTSSGESERILSHLGKSKITAMSIDMGAGTTDISVFEYDCDSKRVVSILGHSEDVKRNDSGREITFGGREIDGILADFYKRQIGPGLYENLGKGNAKLGERALLRDTQIFKETTVSRELNKGNAVPFPPSSLILPIMQLNPDAYSSMALNRERFEVISGKYLEQFNRLIENALEDAGKKSGEIDVVVLTGGHSVWHFVQDMLCSPGGPLKLNVLKVGGKQVWPIIRFEGEERVAVARGAAMWQPTMWQPSKSPEELYEVGENYYFGRNGVMQDYAEAVKWFCKSAEQGNAKAQCALGDCYRYGLGIEGDDYTNYDEAVKWYRKSAEQGYAEAQYALGCIYSHTERTIMQDDIEAVKWFRKSAEQGNNDAQCLLGVAYAYGRGVSQDYSEAVKWYRKSADQGNTHAIINLAECYEDGKGVPQDYIGALFWYRKGAEYGDPFCADMVREIEINSLSRWGNMSMWQSEEVDRAFAQICLEHLKYHIKRKYQKKG